MFMGQDDNAFIGGAGGEAACALDAPGRAWSAAPGRISQLILELVVALFFTFLGCLLLLLKSGVVGGYQLVLVRALVVMVT